VEVVVEGKGKKRGRKRKDEKREYVINKDQSKFFVDLGSNKNQLELVFDLLSKANNKDYGREVIFRDLVVYSLTKLTDKDIEKVQEKSLGEMEKVQRSLDDYNNQNLQQLTLGKYLIMKLSIK
jgi:hypothetical protein